MSTRATSQSYHRRLTITPNASLSTQVKYVMVGHDEELQADLDMVRSAYKMQVDQVNNANSAAGVNSSTDMTFVGGSASNFGVTGSNRVFHVTDLFVANFTGADSCLVHLYDNSSSAVNTLAAFNLMTMVGGAAGTYFLNIHNIQGLIFSTGFATARGNNSNTVVIMGGILRPKMGFEYQSNIAPME